MRIGFDCAPLVIPHSPGIGRVVESTVRTLEARANLQVVRLSPGPGENLRTWRRKSLARIARDQGLQGLHAFQSAFCFGARVPTVQTVHELSWLHGVREKSAWKQKLWIGLGRRQASAVVCATRFSAADYRRASHRGPTPTIIPWGVDGIFTHEADPQDNERLQAWSLYEVPFALSPGGLRPKKRPADLLRAIAPTPGHVVFTGPMCERWPALQNLARDLKMEQRVHMLVDMPDHELATLYRHARITSVISRSEGFALPVLESLASGTTPLVTANTAQSEVAGEHGIAVPPNSPAELQSALLRAFENPQPCSPSAMHYARDFTWDKTAAHIEALWESLL